MTIAEQHRLKQLEDWRAEQEPAIKKLVQQMQELTESLQKRPKDKAAKQEKPGG